MRSLELVSVGGMHPFVNFFLKSIETHKICHHSNGKCINTCIINQYYIMEVCNCSNEIIINVLSISMIYLRKFPRNYVTHCSIVGQFQ